MSLNDADRQTIRGALTATKGQPYAEAWSNSDVNQLTDNELVAYRNYLTVVKPMFEGIDVPTGGRMILNQHTQMWELRDAPNSPVPTKTVFVPGVTANAMEPPKDINDYMTRFGKPGEQEVWNSSQELYNDAKAQIIGMFTANMAEPQKSAAVSELAKLEMKQLKAIAAILPSPIAAPVTGQTSQPVTGNQMVGLGIPSMTPGMVVNNVPTLSSPKIDWKKMREDNGVAVG